MTSRIPANSSRAADRFEPKPGTTFDRVTTNVSNVALETILNDIDWPTVIKPFPGNNKVIVVATLSGSIWLVDIDSIGLNTSNRSDKVVYTCPYNLCCDGYRCRHCYQHTERKKREKRKKHRRSLFLDIRFSVGSLGLTSENPYEERGLIGMEFDPDFLSNGYFYLYYSQIGSGTRSPPVLPIDPCRPATQHQRWINTGLFSHINSLEQWCHPFHGKCSEDPLIDYSYNSSRLGKPRLQRPLLRIKQPFHNNNGMNNLVWDSSRKVLLLTTGDGGYLNDPFDLAQNIEYPHGKILTIAVHSIIYPTRVEPIAILSELPQRVRQAIGLISKGIRNSHGLLIYRPHSSDHALPSSLVSAGVEIDTSKIQSNSPIFDLTNSTAVEYFLTHNGQSQQEGLFRYDPDANIQRTLTKNTVNIGWSGWDNGTPNTLEWSCSSSSTSSISSSSISSSSSSSSPSSSISSSSISSSSISSSSSSPSSSSNTSSTSSSSTWSMANASVVTSVVRLISWNRDSDTSEISINNGDTLRFLSTDGRFHNVYQAIPSTDSGKPWILQDLLQETQEMLDFPYRPIVENVEQILHFISTKDSNLSLTVCIKPVETLPTDLSNRMAKIQNLIASAEGLSERMSDRCSSTVSVIAYPERIGNNKLLPYFSYLHRSVSLTISTIQQDTRVPVSDLSRVIDPVAYQSSMDRSSGIVNVQRRDLKKGKERSSKKIAKAISSENHYSARTSRMKSVVSQEDGFRPVSNLDRQGTDSRPTHSEGRQGYFKTSTLHREEIPVLGTRLTGIGLYRGGGPLGGSEGLILSEWNRSIHNELSSNTGHLFWINLNPFARLRSANIDVVTHFAQPTYYVCLGYNSGYTRIFLGIYHSPYGGVLKLGRVVELVPVIKRYHCSC